jgi:double-stranded uracil-DNA glycosylase
VPESFDWVAAADARVLVLGTMPSAESLRLGQYYANPRNAFWRIMSDLFGGSADLDYPARLELVVRSGVALWDVLAFARREGSSLDARIERGSEVANDIAGFLREHPRVTTVVLNGSKASQLFDRHIAQTLSPNQIEVTRLPSTSPANAAMSYAAKLNAWRAVADAARR